MCRGWMNFMKCAVIGLLAGTAVGAIFCCKMKEERKDRSVKRKAKKALAAMEDMMCDVQDIFKKD